MSHQLFGKVTSVILLLISIELGEAKIFCERAKMPLEFGHWRSNLKHMASVVVQNQPVTINEGQMYVYENYFPGYIIKYVHVDNLAIKSCGASASLKSGGLGSSSVLIVLHAGTNQEIRSVVDIWGEKALQATKKPPAAWNEIPNVTSLYLFKEFRAVNHNKGF